MAVGTVAKARLRQAVGVEIVSHVVEVGILVQARDEAGDTDGAEELCRQATGTPYVRNDPVRCLKMAGGVGDLGSAAGTAG
ncbi:hypothetical protein Ait01nite_016690 [Actinoplanes italicus]|uniref:Uncharacterized protein n=1 Tax=Actinoplanes italicus TaxID=113567 RepID=A0A2T0JZD7_9ACTN|nr:hypothetical protein CLV67_12267 [Actinoplanes italicus]GIE28624.1 hypothetical protein Ait01nite_016690 [Actinoplanes italicus]